MPKVIQLDKDIVNEYIERGDLRSTDLDLLNSSLQTTLRYVGFGAVTGGGALFFLAKKYNRKWPLPAFAGAVSGSFIGQYAGALSFTNYFKNEGRDPRQVLGALAKISRETDIRRAEKMAGKSSSNKNYDTSTVSQGGGSTDHPYNNSKWSEIRGQNSSSTGSTWDKLRSSQIYERDNNKSEAISDTKTPYSDQSNFNELVDNERRQSNRFDHFNFPRSSEDFNRIQGDTKAFNRSVSEKDL